MLKENPTLEKEYNEKVHNGNEVIHNEAPRETTIDTAEVGGNIKYEQADDIGSVEKQQGVPDYETKEELAQSSQKQATKTEENTHETKDKITTHRKTTIDMER